MRMTSRSTVIPSVTLCRFFHMTGSNHWLTSKHAIVTICTSLVLKGTDTEISCIELLLVKVHMSVLNKAILGVAPLA